MKYINHPELLQEGKLNLDAIDHEINIDFNLYKPSENNKLYRNYSDKFWPTSIKDKMKWFPFITILEHTGNIIRKSNGLISSLLKVFSMFELILLSAEKKLNVLAIRCIKCKRETGLFWKNTTFEEIITKFVLNAILHHVVMSWRISSNEKLKYESDKNNHQDWFNKGPWYDTAIYLRLHGSLFEYFITHARSNRYNLMCYLVAHDKIQQVYEGNENSIGDSSITKNATTEVIKALGATLDFIDIWLKLYKENYDA